MKPWGIAFVVPRYGEEVLGGAEALARSLAEQLTVSRLAHVHVLTTCVRDHSTWRNELPPGRSVLNGVSVRRFPVDHVHRDVRRYDVLYDRLIRGENLSSDEQYEWVHHGAHSPELYAFLEAQGQSYDYLIFVPYLFGTTYYGSAILPRRSILWPCLHDEVYAALIPTRRMYHACIGVMFNTYPESRLAWRLFGHHPGSRIVGCGFSTLQADGERFRQRSGLRAPFVLYSGRFESDKNLPLLIRCFVQYKHRRGGPLRLVLMGHGPEPIPAHRDIVVLGFKQGQEKLDVYAAAALLCQPSINESLSIVIMESWLTGVPVLVHGDCEVTRHHVVQSNGGLYFRDYEEFESVLDLLSNDEPLRRRLAENGRTYVETHYNWSVVFGKFEAALESWDRLRKAAGPDGRRDSSNPHPVHRSGLCVVPTLEA